MKEMPELERLVREEFGFPFAILPVRPRADSRHSYESLSPDYADLPGLKVRNLAGFPLCVARGVQGESDAARVADAVRGYVLHQDFVKPPACAGCALDDQCLGTFRGQLEAYGDAAIQPVRGTR